MKKVRWGMWVGVVLALVIGGCATSQTGGGGSGAPELNPTQERAALMLAGNMAGVALQKYKPEFVPEAVAFCAAYDALKDPERVRGLIQAGLNELAKEEGLEPVMPMLMNSLMLALPLGEEDVVGLLVGDRDLPEFDAEILAKMDFVVEGFCQVMALDRLTLYRFLKMPTWSSGGIEAAHPFVRGG